MVIMRSGNLYALCKVSYVDWIVANGYYSLFMKYCTAHSKIKSRNRLARAFLVKYDLLFVYVDCQRYKVAKVADLCAIAKKDWLDK